MSDAGRVIAGPHAHQLYNQRVSVESHRNDAPASVRCVVITISDTRTTHNDTSGDAIAQATQAGHAVARREIVRDDPHAVRQLVSTAASDALLNVTTEYGITSRDSTYEAIVSVSTNASMDSASCSVCSVMTTSVRRRC